MRRDSSRPPPPSSPPRREPRKKRERPRRPQPQTFDLTLKDILMGGAPVFLDQIARVEHLTLMPIELPMVRAGRLDLFAEADDRSLLHVEVQATNLATIATRMLGYRASIRHWRPGLLLHQIVLYVGPEPMTMPDGIEEPNLSYRFDLIDTRRLDPAPLLASNHPNDIILALFAACTDIEDRVRTVVRRLATHYNEDESGLVDALARLALLAPLRNAGEPVEKEIALMPITINLETHPFASKFFLKGKAEGKEEGIAEGEARGEARGEAKGKAEGKAESLLHLLRRRFEVVPKRVVNRVRAADVKRIDQWFDEAVDAPSLEAIFGKPRTRKAGTGVM